MQFNRADAGYRGSDTLVAFLPKPYKQSGRIAASTRYNPIDVPKSKITIRSNPNERPPTTLSADLTQGLVSGDAGSGGKVEGAQPGIGLWDGDAVALKFLV